jgi:PTH1 family peptidyl-tRNA hydrolase
VKLIVGLGNPGTAYERSRHNAGFLVLNHLAWQHEITIGQSLFDARTGRGRIANEAVLLAEPQTYMNLSGVAVRKLTDYFRTDLADLIVVHDDLDLPFQTMRLKVGGGHAGHKGLISLCDHLGARDFIRVRLGIGRPARKTMVEGYVLSPFSAEEMQSLPQVIRTAAQAVEDILAFGIRTAMERYHGKSQNHLNEEG